MTISKILLGCAFASLSVAANAADLPKRVTPVAPAPMIATWTGFYVGATTGYNFFTNTSATAKPNGALLGLRAGYDYQIAPTFVVGILVDGDLDFGKKSISGTVGGNPYTGEVKHRYTMSVDLKAGYVFNDQVIAYVLGGFTHGDIKGSATVASVTASETVKGNGWNVGAGVEYRFTKQWSAFGEYRYNQIKKDGVKVNVSQAKVGIAFRF
jgi:outer membrane immunogenic protein